MKFKSIKNKITFLLLFTILFIIIIGFAGVVFIDYKTVKQNIVNNTVMHTRLIGEYCVAPLSFDSRDGAKLILSKLRSVPSIANGNLYDEDNQYYASFSRNNDILAHPKDFSGSFVKFQDDYLYCFEPINYQGKKVGSVYIKASTAVLNQQVKTKIRLLVYVFIGLLVIAIIITFTLQRIISKPILGLAGIMKEVSSNADYSVRITRKSNDEINQLYEGFNNMLQQIEQRETERDNINQHLLQAKERAEEADRLKSSFLANMSHEIRTPMNAIVGFADLLQAESLSEEEKKEFVSYIHNSSNSLLTLINDIIDIAKIESNQFQVSRKECHVNSLLSKLLYEFNNTKEKINKSSIAINLNRTDDDIYILTDEYRLRQVMTNLLSNALKYTETGFIEFGCEFSDRKKMLFYVKDSGIGIAKEHQEMIFERFIKAEKQDSHKLYRGAGLGLAISKKIVNLLGGDIWVESEIDKGSAFYFDIPYVPTQSQVSARKHEIIEYEQFSKKFNWRGKLILVAEDELSNFKVIEAILKATNADIMWAENGRQAIFMALNNNVSVVLMDIKMPFIDGYEATKNIKKEKNIPVIAQTAYIMEGEIEKCHEAGCDDYIHKPIDADELLHKISFFIMS